MKSNNSGLSSFLFYLSIVSYFLLIGNTTVVAQKKQDQKEVKLMTSAHSENCKAKIEYTLAYEKGIVSSELNRETQVLTVTYKPNKISVEKIIKVINKLGHEAKEITEAKD